jgi:hypothetical protein
MDAFLTLLGYQIGLPCIASVLTQLDTILMSTLLAKLIH